MTPQHHDRDMYQDFRHGQYMRRWLCEEASCTAAIADDQLTAIRELNWAESHGIQHPDWTPLDGGEPGGQQ